MTESHRRLRQMKREALGPPPWPGPSLSWQPPLAPKQTQAEQNFILSLPGQLSSKHVTI